MEWVVFTPAFLSEWVLPLMRSQNGHNFPHSSLSKAVFTFGHLLCSFVSGVAIGDLNEWWLIGVTWLCLRVLHAHQILLLCVILFIYFWLCVGFLWLHQAGLFSGCARASLWWLLLLGSVSSRSHGLWFRHMGFCGRDPWAPEHRLKKSHGALA